MTYLPRVAGMALALFLGGCAGAGGRATGDAAGARDTATRLGTGLVGGKWVLEDLGGRRVLDEAQATLEFTGDGMVSGHGSCNRFRGPVVVAGDSIEFGPLVATRMYCGEAITNQEMTYLATLNGAERWHIREPYLYIYLPGRGEPLRFVRE
jgi:heat shock protein HslJ